ncbi:MAG: hypothetical protein WCI64_10930, partial [Chlorobium sp.]
MVQQQVLNQGLGQPQVRALALLLVLPALLLVLLALLLVLLALLVLLVLLALLVQSQQHQQ